MLIQIDFETEVPLYMQLRNQIVLGMAKGELQSGESLPSVRQLAADLGINMHTANKAYAMLRTEGLITIHKRKGVVVKQPEDMFADEVFRETLAERLEPVMAEAICRGVGREEFLRICESLFRAIEKEDK